MNLKFQNPRHRLSLSRQTQQDLKSIYLYLIYSSHTERNAFIRKAQTKAYAIDSLHVLDKNMNPRYLGFSQYLSDNALQNSSVIYSFAKDERFKPSDNKAKTDIFYDVQDSSIRRCTTMGFGQKKGCITLPSINNPSPSAYHIETEFDENIKHRRGPTLKPRLMGNYNNKIPGVGTYNLRSASLSKSSIPIKLKSRIKFFYDDLLKQKEGTVSMQKYHPNTKLEENARYTTIQFGIGERMKDAPYSQRSMPGPGAYNVPGCFDRGLKKKLPIN